MNLAMRVLLVSPVFTKDEEIKFKDKVLELTGLEDVILDMSGAFEYTEAGKLKTIITKES